MLNINNKVNYEINIKRKEKKYSWSTVFAWLYLKTIGRILPKRWNRWAENILYYDKTTANNEVQTDAFKTIDGSVQVDLKPEVVEKESQSVVINKDGGVQTDGVALITEEDDEALEEQLEGINQELELERLQNASLKEENRELRSAIEGLEKSYKGLTEDAGEREEELTKYKQDKKATQDKVDEQQKTIFDQYMIIREQGEEIEATRKDNESLQAQIIELKSRLKDKEDKLIELNQQWQASKLVALLKSQTDKLCQAKDKNTELENKVSDLGHENKALRLSVNTLTAQLGEMENLGKQLQSVQESKQQLEIDLEGQLKADTKKLQEAKEGQLAKKAGAVGSIGLRVPHHIKQKKCSEYMRCGKPIHLPQRTIDTAYSIVAQYQTEYRGIVQYYKMAYNLHTLSYLKYVMEVSLVKTLASKYKTTCRKIYRKFGAMIENDEGEKRKVIQIRVDRLPSKIPLITHFGAVSLKWNKWVSISDNLIPIWNKRSEIEQRLLAQTCELCKSQEQIEVHHVRKLADLLGKRNTELPEWKKRMIERQRKTLVVCHECHKKIQYGKYDGDSLTR